MGNIPNFSKLAMRLTREDLGQESPGAEVLGTVSDTVTDPTPQNIETQWTGADGTVEMVEPPPPWEQESAEYSASDARRYVDVPDNWSLRWINPKLLEQEGWRYWQPVTVSHPQVRCKVEQMCAPDGNIRRGGATGDILAWMYTSWVESRRRIQQQKARAQTEDARNRHDRLRDELRRGSYGPHVSLAGDSSYPSQTIAEGKSMRD